MSPRSADKPLDDFGETGASSSRHADYDVYQVSAGVHFPGMMDSMMNLVYAKNLFENVENSFDGKPFAQFVSDIERWIKD